MAKAEKIIKVICLLEMEVNIRQYNLQRSNFIKIKLYKTVIIASLFKTYSLTSSRIFGDVMISNFIRPTSWDNKELLFFSRVSPSFPRG